MATREPMMIHQATSVQARARCGPTAAAAIRYLVHQVPGPSHKIPYRQLPSRRQGSLPHMQASLSTGLHRTHKYRQDCQASLPGPIITPFLPGAPSLGPPAAGPSTWCTRYHLHALGRPPAEPSAASCHIHGHMTMHSWQLSPAALCCDHV